MDEPIVSYDASGNRSFLTADERGSIIALTNSSGTVTSTNAYDEYGLPLTDAATHQINLNTGRFQYTGQAWLSEIGMYYYKNRIYSANLGRFLQTDPIGYGDGMNWYAYAHNDPVNGADPSGLCGGPSTGPCELPPVGVPPGGASPITIVTGPDGKPAITETVTGVRGTSPNPSAIDPNPADSGGSRCTGENCWILGQYDGNMFQLPFMGGQMRPAPPVVGPSASSSGRVCNGFQKAAQAVADFSDNTASDAGNLAVATGAAGVVNGAIGDEPGAALLGAWAAGFGTIAGSFGDLSVAARLLSGNTPKVAVHVTVSTIVDKMFRHLPEAYRSKITDAADSGYEGSRCK